MADGNPNQIIWEEYRKPLVHKFNGFYEVRIQTTHAVVRWDMGEKKGTFHVRNDFGKHAEVIVKERLSDILKAGPEAKMTVQIYQNFSPCKNCSSELIEFKKDKSVDLTIIFGGLYNINRNSCVQSKCRHFTKYPVNEDVSNNKAGLRNLSDAGIQARTFTPDDWSFLYKYLDEPDGPVPAEAMERTEDPRMRADYEDIVPPAAAAAPAAAEAATTTTHPERDDAMDKVEDKLAGFSID